MKLFLFLLIVSTVFSSFSQTLKNLDQKIGFKHIELGKHIHHYPEFSRLEGECTSSYTYTRPDFDESNFQYKYVIGDVSVKLKLITYHDTISRVQVIFDLDEEKLKYISEVLREAYGFPTKLFKNGNDWSASQWMGSTNEVFLSKHNEEYYFFEIKNTAWYKKEGTTWDDCFKAKYEKERKRKKELLLKGVKDL
jgi:hypothetical protein